MARGGKGLKIELQEGIRWVLLSHRVNTFYLGHQTASNGFSRIKYVLKLLGTTNLQRHQVGPQEPQCHQSHRNIQVSPVFPHYMFRRLQWRPWRKKLLRFDKKHLTKNLCACEKWIINNDYNNNDNDNFIMIIKFEEQTSDKEPVCVWKVGF